MPRTRLRFRQILHQGNADARLRRPEVYRTAGLSNLLCLRRTVIVSCMRRTERAARRRKQKRRRHVAARDGCRSIRDVERARGLRRFDFRGARSPEVPARCPSSSFSGRKGARTGRTPCKDKNNSRPRNRPSALFGCQRAVPSPGTASPTRISRWATARNRLWWCCAAVWR